MPYNEWFKWYEDNLRIGYQRALNDNAVEDPPFEQWCRGEYSCYLEDPNDYEVAYNGLFDAMHDA